MYRDGLELLPQSKVNFVLNHCAVGDGICSLPAIIFARLMHRPELEMIVWAPSYMLDLISTLLHTYGDFTYRRFEDFPHKASERNKAEDGPVVINSIYREQFTRNRVSLVDYAFVPLLDTLPENDDQRSYPTAPLGNRKISGQYIVFPVNATSDNKLWHHTVLTPVLQWALDNDYKPVILGKSETTLHAIGPDGKDIQLIPQTHYDKVPMEIRDRCLDLRDQTTLLQARDICGYASCVAGVDGGTIHLAATTDVPIVYGLTTTLPIHRSIVRHGKNNWRVKHVTPKDLACAGCQSNWTLMFGHDFRHCAYGDNICVERLDPQDFINSIIQLTREVV